MFCTYSKVVLTNLNLNLLKIYIFYIYLALLGLSCSAWALEHMGSVVPECDLVAPLHVKSWFHNQGSNWVHCIGRWILNHWITREVPEFELSL